MDQAGPQKAIRKFWLPASLFLLVAAGLIFWLYQPKNTESTYETSTAERGNLSALIDAKGTIRARQSILLAWNTDGRINSMNVSIGDKVTTNDVLADLVLATVPMNIILAESDLVTAQKDLDNLLRSNNNLAQAMQNLADAKQTLKDNQDRYDFLTQQRVPGEVIDDIADQITQAKKQLKTREFIYKLRYARRPDGSTDKALMILQLTDSRQNIFDLTAKYNWYASQTSAIELEKMLTAITLAKAKRDDAQRELDRYKKGTNIVDITAAKAKVSAAQAVIDLSKIIAPFNGTVTQTTIQKGDIVSAGQTAIRLDDLANLTVDLQISEVDINNVALGQPVTLHLDAIPGKSYQGVVSKINQSAKSGQGGINFGVSISLVDPDEMVKPGMSADVTITIKEVSNALLVPNRAVRMHSGNRVVYVLKDGLPVPVIIRLGTNSNEFSQLAGGDLKDGDLIILNPPIIAPDNTPRSTATNTPTK